WEEWTRAKGFGVPEHLLSMLAHRVMMKCLTGGKTAADDIAIIRDYARQDLLEKPAYRKAVVKLSGLAVLCDPIEITAPHFRATLRRTEPADLETEEPALLTLEAFPASFDAVAVIETMTKSVGEAQNLIAWFQALCQIVTCGSVQYAGYEIESNSC